MWVTAEGTTSECKVRSPLSSAADGSVSWKLEQCSPKESYKEFRRGKRENVRIVIGASGLPYPLALHSGFSGPA